MTRIRPGMKTAAQLATDPALGAALGSPLGQSAVVLGDSTSAYGGTSVAVGAMAYGDGWFPQLCALSNQRILNRGQFATPGFTTQQIIDTHLPQVLALNPLPAYAFVLSGHNDARDAATKTAYRSLITQLQTAGIKPIICLCLPITGGTAFNRWLTRLGADLGVKVVDTYSPLADVASRNVAAAYTLDGLHPNGAGYSRLAAAVWADVASLFPTRPALTVKSRLDETDLFAGYGVFGIDVDANGRDDNWQWVAVTGITSRTLEVPDVASPLAGKWQRQVRDSSGTGDSGVTLPTDKRISTGFAVGDVIEMACRFRTTGFPGTGSLYRMRAFCNGAASPYFYLINDWRVDVADATAYRRFTVPAGTTSINFEQQIGDPTSGSVTVDIGEVTARNLTALGVA